MRSKTTGHVGKADAILKERNEFGQSTGQTSVTKQGATETMENGGVIPNEAKELGQTTGKSLENKPAEMQPETSTAVPPRDDAALTNSRLHYSNRAYNQENLQSRPARFCLPGFCGERDRCATLEECSGATESGVSDPDTDMMCVINTFSIGSTLFRVVS